MTYRKPLPQRACRDLEQEVILYYYGECPGEERHRVETHLKACESCQIFLKDLAKLLPLTVKADDPPQAFWESYSLEIKEKLKGEEERLPWWRRVYSLFPSWPAPALVTASVLILALALVFTKGIWRSDRIPPEEKELQKILTSTENVEFFRSLEFLETMDLLRALEGNGSDRGLSQT